MTVIPREVREEGVLVRTNKQIPPGCELVSSECAGQKTMYFLRRIDTRQLVSSLPRSESGQCLYNRKTWRKFAKQVDRNTSEDSQKFFKKR